MTHEEHMDDTDRDQLERAYSLIRRGRELRDKVKSRLATRAWRHRKNNDRG